MSFPTRRPLFVPLIRGIGRWLLRRRYVVDVQGLDAIRNRGRAGILFLPNHPALIDPVLLLSILHRDFQPAVLADQDRLQGPFLRTLAEWFGALPIPDPTRHGAGIRPEIEHALQQCAKWLTAGGNLIFYPSGRLQRGARENLGGNSGASILLQYCPHARVVLVRTLGLWGSVFSWGPGRQPSLTDGFRTAMRSALTGLLFFIPLRRVKITFEEHTASLPPPTDKRALNRYLESFYNAEVQPNTYVPYSPFERSGPRSLPEPFLDPSPASDSDEVPSAVREAVLHKLEELTGTPAASMRNEMDLARDLNMDSLALMEFIAWAEDFFHRPIEKAEAIHTVGDLFLAAAGLLSDIRSEPIPPAPPLWFQPRCVQPPGLPDGRSIPELFFRTAWQNRESPIVADTLSGVKTYRDLILAVSLLARLFRSWEEEKIGILLPGSVAASVTILAVQSAGKVPVMANWTVGLGPMLHGLQRAGVRRMLTARRFWERLQSQWETTPLGFEDSLVFLEDIRSSFSPLAKAIAWFQTLLPWPPTPRSFAPTAVLLFTSGSESRPKTVPLTHENILWNLRDVLSRVRMEPSDVLLGMLPPFHSYGLSTNVVLPLCAGLRCVYFPNPTDGRALAKTVAAYGATVLLTTPTFLAGILRNAGPDDLRTLRLTITGAEKCPDSLYAAFQRRCPAATLLEGYGITECSPIVSLNDEKNNHPGTIGKVLPSLEWARKDPESDAPATPDRPGLLLVRGPTVFSGYLDAPQAEPFVEWQGKRWYNTGDLVLERPDGVLQFAGRLKRFVKLGGEMISLPAIEEALQSAFAPPDGNPAPLAVEATPDELNPALVLFLEGDQPITREQANSALRKAGLSPLHSIASVIHLDALPRLGSGKVDYRALRARLEQRKPV